MNTSTEDLLTEDLFGYKAVTCSACHGSGEHLHEDKSCEECDGTGEISE
jgi:DnaJ-class molecular chaperone